MTHDPIRWLAAEQPLTTEPDVAATGRARRALLAHAADARPVAAAPTERAERAERRWLRPSRVLALAAVAGVAAVAAVGIPALTRGDGPLAVPEASAAPLVRLSERVRAEPAPAGDATLVRRTHHFSDGSGMTGADLYLDDGRYFYSPTVSGLPAQVAAGNDVGDSIAREIAAVAAAASPDLPIGEAVRRAVASTWAPGASGAQRDVPPMPAQEAARAKIATDPASPPASRRALDENRVWLACLDALQAAAGRTDVRAGALRLLATISTVTVETTAVAGRPALVVTSTGFGGGYRERLAMDPDTGIPFRFEGGKAGQRPSVVMDFGISRVTASEVKG